MNQKIHKVRNFLKEMHVDGWLIYDFHKTNHLAHRFLEIPSDKPVTRRFFYWIPIEGEPVRLVHAIEFHVLDDWPGEKRIFFSWQSLRSELQGILKGGTRVAMEYSPHCNNPYISLVDGGTIDLIRSFGIDIVSSGYFLGAFIAVINAKQGESHIRAGKALDDIVHTTWNWIAHQLRQDHTVTEYAIQQKILEDFRKRDLITDAFPIVAINAHSADPHFMLQEQGSSILQKGDLVLIDLWAKEKQDGAIFADITRVAVASARPTDRQEAVFRIVREAQKAGIEFVKCRFREKKKVMGYEVDDVVRGIIQDAGYGDHFLHRTGHNIEVNLHGSGTHLDNLEMHDERPIVLGTCFSIEPGIYFPGEFGIRLESDVYVHDGRVEVTGGEQEELYTLMK